MGTDRHHHRAAPSPDGADMLLLRWHHRGGAEHPAGAAAFAALADAADRIALWEPAPLRQPEAPRGGTLRRYRRLLRIGAERLRAPFLYTVEADVDPEHEEELNAWYDEEHLPRLAAVPGVLSATRYVETSGASPRYLAAYRLEAKEVFESPAWITARETPWTHRARTYFRHPRREMRRLLEGTGPAP